MNDVERALFEAILQMLLKQFPNLTPAVLWEQVQIWFESLPDSSNNPPQPPP